MIPFSRDINGHIHLGYMWYGENSRRQYAVNQFQVYLCTHQSRIGENGNHRKSVKRFLKSTAYYTNALQLSNAVQHTSTCTLIKKKKNNDKKKKTGTDCDIHDNDAILRKFLGSLINLKIHYICSKPFYFLRVPLNCSNF